MGEPIEEYQQTNGNYKTGNSRTEKYNIGNENFSGTKQKIQHCRRKDQCT